MMNAIIDGMKTATAEQKQRAVEKRAKMRKLAAVVGKMTDEARLEMAARYPISTIEGRALSPHNQCLLIMQANGAMPTVVGGFRQWKTAGRSVKKGEHGLSIWIPSTRKFDGLVLNGEKEPQDETYFICGTVFDISQTEESSAREAVEEVNAEIARIENRETVAEYTERMWPEGSEVEA
jgi:antirestriction protein ArdC